MKVCLGGTFDLLHVGHKALLEKAFEIGNEIFIGITSDEMVVKWKKKVSSFKERKDNLEKYLEKKGWSKRATIGPIDDRYGPALTGDFDAIIVSPETHPIAGEMNEYRIRKGRKELEIIEIPFLLARDGIPISSTRIKNGEIDVKGERSIPLKIGIGSKNEVKIKACRRAFEKVFPISIKVKGINSGDYQPFNDDIEKGAISRARNAIKEMDYGVGIEAGIKWNEVAREYFGIQYCSIIDKTGYITWGHSSGFTYPKKIIEEVRKGKSVGEVIEAKEEGAIGYLSKGIINREDITERAVLMALLPRISNNSKFFI